MELFGAGWKDDAPWDQIALECVNRLALALGCDVGPDSEVIHDSGFSVEVRGRGGIVSYRGTVGGDIVDERLCIRAWLFPYAGGVLLQPPNTLGIAALVFELLPAGWSLDSWSEGFPGEYDAYRTWE